MRRNRYLNGVGIGLIVAALVIGTSGCIEIPDRDVEIRTWHDLDAIRNNLGGSYLLLNDLDPTTPGYTELAGPYANDGKGWQPIGSWWDARFTGSFDGQGYKIHDLFINRPDEGCVGLFGAVAQGGVVEDIDMVNGTATGGWDVGSVVGSNGGTVSDSRSTLNVTGKRNVGGLVGYNRGTVGHSYAEANVTGTQQVGGLVGLNSRVPYHIGPGIVRDCHATGSVTGNEGVGGLVGYNRAGKVCNSYYNCDVVLINGKNIITIGALFGDDFEEWLASDKCLDVNERLYEEDGCYLINNLSDFKQLLAFGQDEQLRFRLTDDLDLAGEPSFYIPYLAGQIDGNGHKIVNLSFTSGHVSQVGLFGYLALGGKVSEVGVENTSIMGCLDVGGLVGTNDGTVSNSYSTGSVIGDENIGGLVGRNRPDGIVSNSHSAGIVTGDENVGGLVGLNDGTVSNSHSACSVAGNSSVGGLLGENHFGDVTSSHSTGSVTGHRDVGGLVGHNYWSPVTNSYSTGSVTGDENIGGLVGSNFEGTVSNSYSTGSVTGGWFVGGLVGDNHGYMVTPPVPRMGGSVSNSYSTSSVTGYGAVGGLVGHNRIGTVSSSYSAGSVGGYGAVGGLVGANLYEHEDSVEDSFWDVSTSGQTTGAGGTGKTTAEMKSLATFVDTETAGLDEPWDIVVVVPGITDHAYTWNIVDGETYPFLNWELAGQHIWIEGRQG